MQLNEDEMFDFAFVDADKENFSNYHERLLKIVKIGGLILYDNTLWFGSIVMPMNPDMPKYFNEGRESIIKFNKELAADPRIELCQVCIGDGLTICRRVDWDGKLWMKQNMQVSALSFHFSYVLDPKTTSY